MIVKLLTEHHLEFLSLKGGSRGSSASTLVKMSNCWKSDSAANTKLTIVFHHPRTGGQNYYFSGDGTSQMETLMFLFAFAFTGKNNNKNNKKNKKNP